MKRLYPILLILVLITGCISDKTEIKGYKGIQGVPDLISHSTEKGIVSYGNIRAYVKRAVDGDTLVVVYCGKDYRVRLLDIDTPESVKKGTAVQSYAKEASKFTKEMAGGEKVKLIFEKGLRDKYDRLLAHVFLNDGTYLNAVLVRNGFARTEVISPNTALQGYFLDLQKKAIEDKTGLWSLPEAKRPFVKDRYGEYIPRYWLEEDAS